MGVAAVAVKSRLTILRTALLCTTLLLVGPACHISPAVSTRQIIRQQALLDFTGLSPAQVLEYLHVNWAVPRDWQELPAKRGPMFTHQQYRSPTGATGVGVAYVRLPFPLPASTIAWVAQREYVKRHGSGEKEAKVFRRWSDPAGREWFEGENGRYHGVGYVMAKGNQAWIVYSGYRLSVPPNAEEISISRRSAKTIVPMVN